MRENTGSQEADGTDTHSTHPANLLTQHQVLVIQCPLVLGKGQIRGESKMSEKKVCWTLQRPNIPHRGYIFHFLVPRFVSLLHGGWTVSRSYSDDSGDQAGALTG